MTKKVSIIVPTHNRPDTLTEALDSIAKQTYKDIEVIVVNDGECDVQDIISAASKNMEIKYINHHTSKGPAAARNTGLHSAEGKYIAYLDDDDIIYPAHIQTLTDFLETSEYKAVYTDAYRVLQERRNDKYVTIAKEIYHSQDFNRDYFLVASYIAIQSIMHEKACLEKTGYFDESLATHEDLDMWIRLSHWYDFAHIAKVTSEFKEKNDDISQTGSNKQRRLTNLELIYKRYSQWASPKIQYLQKRVLQRMYANYGIELPEHLK
ncbi:MAG: hypothetical protein A2Y10_04680 [Planctomycetes bacterium GWF2_41_51]|nr:MAG: hypothetical protein A2Y10_04680 [Planctomycetes bacterium GWF2_41_51]HBG26629.1 hypothetical protein [Phycisphaerales bacterium]